MNFYFAFIFLLLFSTDSVEQENNGSYDFSEILQKKETNYFDVKKKLKKISIDDIIRFHDLCVLENYEIGEIYALNRLGIYYKKKEDYKKALEYHNKALIFCKKSNIISVQMVCLNLIGSIYYKQDDIRNALVYHRSVIILGKEIKEQTFQNRLSLSIANNRLGNIYALLKQYSLAIKQFQKSIALQEKIKKFRGLAINHQNIGSAYENLGFFNKALIHYENSLDFNNQLNSDFGRVICNNNIAVIAIKQKQYKKALAILEKNYILAKEVKNKYYTLQTLANLGWAQLKLKFYEKANNNLNEVLNKVDKLKSPKSLKIKVLNHLSELFENKKELEKALLYCKKAIDIEDVETEKRNNIFITNLISKKNIEEERNNYKELQNENQIKSLQLTRNRNILIITLITIALLTAVLYSIYRQHLLKNDQKILLLEQQALQTQMNPHFVFNALNSIKHYIINNEQKNAVYYLNKFSKLIRNILEVSKVKEVSLKEELNTMSLYMSIENIRFDNAINYIEDINSDLNTDTIKLPPLVLQPFIENAIWHGLSSKENGKKEIVLSAQKVSENLLEINITDNGVGRRAALEIKKNKSLKRKSIGVELTKERLNTFCNEYLAEFSLKYYDLMDKEGIPIGTKVSLQIPLS